MSPSCMRSVSALFCCTKSNDTDGNSITSNAGEVKVTAAPPSEVAPDSNPDAKTPGWMIAVDDALAASRPDYKEFLINNTNPLDLDTSIAFLHSQYESKGVTSKIGLLEPILLRIDSFAAGFASITNSSQAASIIWGGLLIVLRSTLNFLRILDDITHMLEQLTFSMPIIRDYMILYPTPRTQDAMIAVYSELLGFCLTAASYLDKSPLGNLARLLWSPIERNFDKAIKTVQTRKADFDAEVLLAGAQAAANRHQELSAKIAELQTTMPKLHRAINVPLPRNPLFQARGKILEAVRSALQPHTGTDDQKLKSFALHGIGGVGKTQIAVEYTYRYRHLHPFIFWVRAETDLELVESFASIGKDLGRVEEGEMLQLSVQKCMDWLATTDESWLLVFDNVATAKMLKSYWPRSTHGSVMITSQNPDVLEIVCSSSHVQPFEDEEGASMILSNLRDMSPTMDSVKSLSTELGGLPLAISHFTAYMNRSRLSVPETVGLFLNRRQSADVWSASDVTTSGMYERTLSTVWDFALQKLTEDAKELLDILSFLHPDSIPEEMLLAEHDALPRDPVHTKPFALHKMLASLQQSHLVNRNVDSDEPTLQLHRALKKSILHRLDQTIERRQIAFDRAFIMTRTQIPKRQVVTRTTILTSRYEKYIPQLISLRDEFDASDPAIKGTMELADLLCDASWFLWEQQLSKDAIPMLQTAERICKELLHPEHPDAVLATILGCMALFMETNNDTREQALQYQTKVVDIRRKLIEQKPIDQVTRDDRMDLGRAKNDLGGVYLNAGDPVKGLILSNEALDIYRMLGTEDELKYRFGNTYWNVSLMSLGQGKYTEARKWAKRSSELVEAELGPKHMWTCIATESLALVYLSTGDIQQALNVQSKVLHTRRKTLTETHADTLTSMYWNATMRYHLGDFQLAEDLLHEALRYSHDALWGKDDIARAQFRLALVQKALGKTDAAVAVAKEAASSLTAEEQPEDLLNENLMEIYDTRVSVWHGRSTGIFGIRAFASKD